MGISKYNIKILESADELPQWRNSWLDLLAKQEWPTIFHHPDWIEACFSVQDNQLKIGIIYQNQQLFAIFVLSSIFSSSSAFLYPVKCLSLEPQISTVRPPCLIGLIDSKAKDLPLKETLEEAIESIEWDVGFFQYINHRESWLIEPLKQVLKEKKYELRDGDSAPEAYIDLTKDPNDIIDSRSSKLRRSLNNAVNRLEKETDYRFIELVEHKYEWQHSKEIMLTIFSNTWQCQSEISPFHESNIDHILPVIKKFYQLDQFRILVLFVNSKPIGFEAYFLYENVLFPVCRGFDENFKRYSPGNLLIRESLFHFAKKDIKGIYYGPFRRVDKTGYKQRWATKIWESPNLLCIKPKSKYGRLEKLYRSSKLFRKLWWKFNAK